MSLLFDEASVLAAKHPLVRRIRWVFYRKQITDTDYDQLFKSYAEKNNIPLQAFVGDTRAAFRTIRPAIDERDYMEFIEFSRILSILGMNDTVIEEVLQDGTSAAFTGHVTFSETVTAEPVDGIQEYRVTWVTDLLATSPYNAAMRARAMQHDPQSIATVFEVTDSQTRTTRIINLGVTDLGAPPVFAPLNAAVDHNDTESIQQS